jgi:uncharacterized cupredoxin-like copper-binding protein
MVKVATALGAALATVAVVAAIATAQQPVPVVAVTASPTAVAVQATGPVASGPTRFQITRQASRRGLNVYFALLNAGVTVPDIQAALRRDDRTNGDQSLGMASIHGAVSFSGSETRRDVTFTLKPGQTYVMVTEPETQNGPPPTRGFGTFATAGQANGATAPAPDATVRMVDLRFRGAATLPRRGTIRVENVGAGPHIAIAFPLRSSNQQAANRLIAGAPTVLQNILSGGGNSNDQTVSFARSGRYALVCFFNDHERLGMYRIVSVR